MSLPVAIAVFVAMAITILSAGWKLANLADRLADRTGMGEAIAGALFLGASTSLPGIITSAVAAEGGYPQLAVSNAVGGIAAQTAFLSIADITYKRANLEHAAASASSIMQGALLIVLLSIPLLAYSLPPWTVFGVNLATPAMLAAYLYGMHMISGARTRPMWRPRHTSETREDEPDSNNVREALPLLLLKFAAAAATVGAAGWAIAKSAVVIMRETGLSESVVGTLFTSVSTSLPELVTAVAAVHQGALVLAIGDIIGGNTFDTLFLAVSDVFYREGSIYHAMHRQQLLFLVLTILMTAILLMGLVRREERGIANIGFESFLILVLYAAGILFLFA